MSPFTLLWLLLAAVFAVAVARLMIGKRSTPLRDDVEPAIAGNGYHFTPKTNISFDKIKAAEPTRVFGKRPELAAPYGKGKYGETLKPRIFLTPRQIERVNIQRKLRGKPPFNRKGLQNAIAHPFDRAEVRQPQSSNDWLSYLIMYEIIFADHQGHTVSGCGGVTIDGNEPYNGHGGEYAGAGASGDWRGNNDVNASAAAIEHGIPIVGEPETAAPAGTGGFAPLPPVSDSAPSYSSSTPDTPSVPDSAPSYSAPDPTPSFDSSSSFSSPSVDTSSSF